MFANSIVGGLETGSWQISGLSWRNCGMRTGACQTMQSGDSGASEPSGLQRWLKEPDCSAQEGSRRVMDTQQVYLPTEPRHNARPCEERQQGMQSARRRGHNV